MTIRCENWIYWKFAVTIEFLTVIESKCLNIVFTSKKFEDFILISRLLLRINLILPWNLSEILLLLYSLHLFIRLSCEILNNRNNNERFFLLQAFIVIPIEIIEHFEHHYRTVLKLHFDWIHMCKWFYVCVPINFVFGCNKQKCLFSFVNDVFFSFWFVQNKQKQKRVNQEKQKKNAKSKA